jgi:pimeloyl-ACP methyl ester carboxylesterase
LLAVVSTLAMNQAPTPGDLTTDVLSNDADPAGGAGDWHRINVDGRTATYTEMGTGMPVVFLHGWALGHRTYHEVLQRISAHGTRVLAPALPGFGGTADLPGHEPGLRGYADWVDAFVEALEIDEPVVVVGHSFGGGVAIKFAHRHPARVRALVPVNSIGGGLWKSDEEQAVPLGDRPWWDWSLRFPADVLPLDKARTVLPVILRDAVPNLVRNPRALIKAGRIAKRADLTRELEDLKDRGLPVVVLWGMDDEVIPKASFDALCDAVGASGELVDGNHSWLLADPDAFGEVVTNVIGIEKLARTQEQEAADSRFPRARRWWLRRAA